MQIVGSIGTTKFAPFKNLVWAQRRLNITHRHRQSDVKGKFRILDLPS